MSPVLVDCSFQYREKMFSTDADEWMMDQEEAREISLDLVRHTPLLGSVE